MSNAAIFFKTDAKLKKQAQQVANRIGLSLSDALNGLLRHFVKTKTITFTAKEEPTPWMLQQLKESKEDVKAGRVASFKNLGDELSYLDKLIKNDKKRNKS